MSYARACRSATPRAPPLGPAPLPAALTKRMRAELGLPPARAQARERAVTEAEGDEARMRVLQDGRYLRRLMANYDEMCKCVCV